MAFTAIYALGVTFFIQHHALPSWTAGNEIIAALTVVLGTLIVFRTNSANDRWWEARKLWAN